MISFQMSVADLALTRFAISPMWELVASLRLLQQPDRAALHLPWVNEVRPRVREIELPLERVFPVLPPEGYIPDFLTPPPSGPLASFEDELEQVVSTPVDQISHDIAFLHDCGTPPAGLVPFVEDPQGAVARMGEVLAEYWRVALEPHWPRIRALLEADLAYRSRRLTEVGPAGLFDDLHPCIRMCEDQLEIQNRCEVSVRPREEGLILLPSAFQWRHPASITEEPWHPTVIYPARGIGLLWEPGDRSAAEALEKVLGSTRAQILEQLDAPVSTTALAGRLGITAGGASQHLSALRGAGLVAASRDGRSVLHVRTPLAEQLIGGGA